MKIRLSYSSYTAYRTCPKKYKFSQDRVDPKGKNCYHIVAGEMVQKFFEMYSNHWLKSEAKLSDSDIRERMRPYWDRLLKYNYVDWDHPMSKLTREGLFNECLNTIYENLDEFDLYEDCRSEVKIEVKLKNGDELISKIDFIKDMGEDKVALWDGKNSQTIGKYTDDTQLLFYALMYRFKYGKVPNELGFIYYRHKKLVKIEFSPKDLDQLWVEIVKVFLSIKKTKNFVANPSAKNCNFCDYIDLCKEGKEGRESRKRGPRNSIKIENAIKEEDGLFRLPM